MKKIIFALVVMSSIAVACNSDSNQKSETTITIENADQKFACAMHADIIGKKGEKCSKCGMELTLPVVTKDTTAATK
jgi:nitrous oxide reductase accessory protein NosL